MSNHPGNRIGNCEFNDIRNKVVSLRCHGHSSVAIAKMLGISHDHARAILRSEFEDRFAARDELKHQTAAQMDFLFRPLAEKYEADTALGKPDRRDAEAMLKIIDRRCRLFGLDEAVKVDVRQVEALSDAELDAELVRHGVRQLEPPPLSLPPAEPAEDADWEPATTEPEPQP